MKRNTYVSLMALFSERVVVESGKKRCKLVDRQKFLPVNKQDMQERGWEQLDFIVVSGDAYVDHPSFGTAIVSRVLEHAGYRVGIIAQPDWHSTEDFKRLGRPKLGFLVGAGNLDSMVNHYTVTKKHRQEDAYSPGGKMGLRPDRATLAYVNRLREAYKKTPIIIGGVEASLRRFAHFDYWSNNVRRSMLVDSEADLLIYGMSERQIVEVADFLSAGLDIRYLHHLQGTCYVTQDDDVLKNGVRIPDYEKVAEDTVAYAKAFKIQYDEQDPIRGRTLIQRHKDRWLVQNPPAMPLTTEEMDAVYALPYTRTWHPDYDAAGGVPAIEEVQYSLVSERGCFGACSFCALTFHQGRIIQARSHDSLLEEAEILTGQPGFKGYIHDVGGPTANFRFPSCAKQLKVGTCKDRQCLWPKPCPSLRIDHSDYLALLRKLREIPKVKKVFIRSGIRYDYLLADPSDEFMKELVTHHVSGQLKVAPEHISDAVLQSMGKPCGKLFKQFSEKFFAISKAVGKEQYLVPYLMSSHPGSTLKSAIELAEYLRDMGYQPEQVQDFYPTPGTLSTCMFHTGLDPRTMKPVYVPKDFEEKRMQRALLQFRNPKNHDIVRAALETAGRTDLIGFGPLCLAPPPRGERGTGTGRPSKDGTPAKKKRTYADRSDARSAKGKNASSSEKSGQKAGTRNTAAAALTKPGAPKRQAASPKLAGTGRPVKTHRTENAGSTRTQGAKRPSGNKKQQTDRSR